MAVKERLAARALVLSSARRILLLRFRFPWREADVWITPGGALEPGEDARAARYFLVEVSEFEPIAHALEEGDEADWFRGFRWWPLDEIPDVSAELAPRRLGELVRALLRDGVPPEPLAIPV